MCGARASLQKEFGDVSDELLRAANNPSLRRLTVSSVAASFFLFILACAGRIFTREKTPLEKWTTFPGEKNTVCTTYLRASTGVSISRAVTLYRCTQRRLTWRIDHTMFADTAAAFENMYNDGSTKSCHCPDNLASHAVASDGVHFPRRRERLPVHWSLSPPTPPGHHLNR